MLLSSSSPNPDLLSTHPRIHREDPRRIGTSTELHSSTGCEPKRIELNRILVNPQNQTIDDQDDIEEIGVKPLSHSQSLIHSADDSAESIATPHDSDFEDEQLRKMLASPLRNERKMKDKTRAYHSKRESLMINSFRNSEVSGRPDVVVFMSQCIESEHFFRKRQK